MSDLAIIRAAIVGRLQGVAGVGIVHDRRRNLRTQQDLLQHARVGALVNVWMVCRAETAEASPDLGIAVVEHRWEIRGFRQFDDAAGGEVVLDDVVEAIRDAFRASEDLGIAGLTTVTEEIAGIQVKDTQPVVLAGVICAACRLHLVTRIVN